MDATQQNEHTTMKNDTKMERTSDRELVITRSFNGPARIVFDAWTKPELFQRWWVPKSFPVTMVSCEMDARTGGSYRLGMVVSGDTENPKYFFGKYREVTPLTRIVWTNDEAGDSGPVTTVTFEEKAGKTLCVMRELYPTKEALDEELESGAKSCTDETFTQLAEVLVTIS